MLLFYGIFKVDEMMCFLIVLVIFLYLLNIFIIKKRIGNLLLINALITILYYFYGREGASLSSNSKLLSMQ